MNALLIGVVFLVAILVVWLAWQSLRGREKSGALESQMNELRRDLQTIATSQARSTDNWKPLQGRRAAPR